MIRARRSPRSGGLGRRARATVWGHRSPVPDAGQVVVDLDATLIGAHSEKEGATPNFKRGFGFHPMLAFVDHGAGGTGEPLAAMLRPGRANANDAADQIAVLDAALAQLPEEVRPRVLVRGDTGSGVKAFLWHIHRPGLAVLGRVSTAANPSWMRWPHCPTGLAPGTGCRRPPRDGAQVAELTRWLPATFVGWPPGMRVIARRERPHPGAQLRITDHHGWRITVFATNTPGGRLADLEVRHRLRARAEDRIRGLKDTGLTNLPLQAFAKNQIWLELAALASELLTWTQLLAWPDQPARTWEPKRLRLRLLAVAARLITTGRRRILRLCRRWPWADLLTSGHRTPRRARLNSTHQHLPTKDQENRRHSAGDHPRPHPDTDHNQPKPTQVDSAHERRLALAARLPDHDSAVLFGTTATSRRCLARNSSSSSASSRKPATAAPRPDWSAR